MSDETWSHFTKGPWMLESSDGSVSAFYARPITYAEREQMARDYRRLPNRLRRARRKLTRPFVRLRYTWRVLRHGPEDDW